jgi:polar amino acid transport system ATP-binding protein
MTGTPFISFRKVYKAFGANRVLDGFDVDLMRGEKIAIIGPSGSGKTTILRILMTLESIDRGGVTIDGAGLWTDCGDRPSVGAQGAALRTIRSKIGMVFQSFNLFPHMTAIQNIAEAPMTVLRRSKDEAYADARDLLKKVGLEGKESSFPIQLSGGQQQRVAIARALAMKPQIMLFDEVTSALDPELVGEVLNVIRQLAREQDLTILMVTHQMGFAREFADRVCFIDGGRIVEQGAPQSIFQSPQNPRTQAFLRAVLEA